MENQKKINLWAVYSIANQSIFFLYLPLKQLEWATLGLVLSNLVSSLV